MLVYNEGVPRSGKSYDFVRNHMLPALRKGRRVFARLNGLDDPRCLDAIAAHLAIPVERVRELLHHVDTADVKATFAAYQDESGKWTIDPKFRNALVCVDEVHEYWEGGTREKMPPENEQFFALHGHYGIDAMVMTQFYSRIHKAIRHRIERKNVFQKLSALGSKGEKLFRQSYYQTIRPDKFELVSAETHAYDPAIYPLYHGIAPVQEGEAQVEQAVYDAGRSSVWKGLVVRAAIIVPLGLFAIFYLLNFFSGGGTKLVKQPASIAASAPRKLGPDQGETMSGVSGPVAQPAQPAQPAPKPEPHATLSPEQRYVWDLSDSSRIRLAALVGEGATARGVVEWVDASQVIKERLSTAQIEALGVVVTVRDYGLQLTAGDEMLIATAWPLNAPLRDTQPTLYDTSGGRSAVGFSPPLSAAAVEDPAPPATGAAP